MCRSVTPIIIFWRRSHVVKVWKRACKISDTRIKIEKEIIKHLHRSLSSMNSNMKKTIGTISLGLFLCFDGCGKRNNGNSFVPRQEIKKPSSGDTDPGSKMISFNRTNGAYTKAMATADFGVPIEMNWQNIDIVSNEARVRIPANSLSQGN